MQNFLNLVAWRVHCWIVTSWPCDELAVWRIDCLTSWPCDDLVMWRVDWQPLPLSSDIAHNLTNEYHHNLPCVASLANHWPARTRTNGLIHKEAHPVVPDLLYHFKGTDASTALWSSSFHLLITLFEKKGPRCRRDQKMCFNNPLHATT